MYTQEEPGKAERSGAVRAPKAPGVPTGAGPAPVSTTAAGLPVLQRLAGNAAVSATIAAQRHRHDAGCGHLPVQREAAQDRHEHDPGCGHLPVQRRALVHDVVRTAGESMEPGLRSEMEGRFGGADFSGVRVHKGPAAKAAAQELGARALTTGRNIVVGDTMTKKDWAHELTHVEDQMAGPVPGTDIGGDVSLSSKGDSGERHAEQKADRVMSAPAPSPVQRTPDGAQHGPAAGPAAGGSAPIQRLVGFEAELSVPSYEVKPSATGLTPIEGRQPHNALTSFFYGGAGYASDIASGNRMKVVTDHNVLQHRGREIHEALSDLTTPDGRSLVPDDAEYDPIGNIEYVTDAVDELAPGSDRTVLEMAQEIDEHVAGMFAHDPRSFASFIPGSGGEYATGFPLPELQAWLGPELFKDPELQKAIAAYQKEAKHSLYLQATAGILPSGLPHLYEAQQKVEYPPAPKGKEHTRAAQLHATAAVVQASHKIRSFLAGNMPQLGELDREALTGALTLTASYAIGSALVMTDAVGETSTAKNAVSHLAKLGDLAQVRTKATTDTVRNLNFGHEDLMLLAKWLHEQVAETNVGFWLNFLKPYGRGANAERTPAYGPPEEAGGVASPSQNPVEATYMLLNKVLNGENAELYVLSSGSPFKKPDPASPHLSREHTGGQQGVQMEFRWLPKRITEAGHLAGAFASVVEEVRTANLKGAPKEVADRIRLAAATGQAAPVTSSGAADRMEVD
ncbi:MAG: DUF4157 domain-containing protein [Streptomyces sp.]|uniref:eCIS core domain-containing protein n=1 Tax=Streptomyces sp. TaxID=1931 RepID=UPI0025FA5E84|nr:DUF4157 domain-containing protein [Streptomyces sp.]MBW8798016.1 DUF4157 domain-containing protein [Streptomyces sp.]